MLVDDELEPLGLLDEDEAPPLADEPAPVPPELLDDPPLPDEPLLIAPPPDELLVPPVPLLELESAGGVLGVDDDEDDDPPGTTTVSFDVVDDDDEPLGEVVVDPPGTTVVDSFFSHAASAKAPISTNRYPLRFMFTLLSSEFTPQKRTAGLAIDVPAPGTFLIKDAPWRSRAR